MCACSASDRHSAARTPDVDVVTGRSTRPMSGAPRLSQRASMAAAATTPLPAAKPPSSFELTNREITKRGELNMLPIVEEKTLWLN